MKDKKHLLNLITSIVILILSILILNLITLQFVEKQIELNINEENSRLATSTSQIVNLLLKNNNLDDLKIQKVFNTSDLIKEKEIFLIDNDGNIIVHKNQKRLKENVRANELFNNVLKSVVNNSTFYFENNSNEKVIASMSKLDDYDFFAVSITKYEIGMVPFKLFKERLVALSIIIVFIGSVLFFVSNKLIRN